MAARGWIALAVVSVTLSPAAGQEKPAKDPKKAGPIKVEITGVLQAGEKKGTWAIKITPAPGAEFTWPVGFHDEDKGAAELEKTAQRLRNKAVVVTGELVYIPASTAQTNPLSTLPPAQFPAVTLVIAHTVREAK